LAGMTNASLSMSIQGSSSIFRGYSLGKIPGHTSSRAWSLRATAFLKY
jgi:hypothetical protein